MANKKSLFGLFVLLTPLCVQAQGINITSGTSLVLNNTSQLVVNNGSFNNDGNFAGAGSTVVLAGDIATSLSAITGTSPLTFYNLSVNKTFNDVLLNNNISVVHTLDMVSDNLDLNGNTIDLGSSGIMVSESETSHVISSSTGDVISTVTLNSPTGINPGNMGLEITSTANLGSVIIRRGYDRQVINSNNSSINRYYDILPIGNIPAADLHLKFNYLDADLAGISPDSLTFWASPIGSMAWTFYGRDFYDTTSKYVSKNGVFSSRRVTLSNSNVPLATGIAVQHAVASVKVYPNPASNNLNVKLTVPAAADYTLMMYDVTGKMVSSKQAGCHEGENIINWNIDELASGAYYLQFSDNSIAPIKIIKE